MIEPSIISGPGALKEFRGHWTGEAILSLLRQNDGKLLITWPVGVGKSHNIDSVIETAISTGLYDLVIVFTPTTAVLNERRWVKNPPEHIKIVILKPRPSDLCGGRADKRWQKFEKNGLGALGRNQLCRPCAHFKTCFWPGQYGKNLEGARVIFCNQAHLERDRQFISKLSGWARAKKVLAIIDESAPVTRTTKRQITRHDLECYMEVLRKLNDELLRKDNETNKPSPDVPNCGSSV